jgi:hypothetical protein
MKWDQIGRALDVLLLAWERDRFIRVRGVLAPASFYASFAGISRMVAETSESFSGVSRAPGIQVNPYPAAAK